MNKKFKKQWIHALRSGKYEQRHGQLYEEITNTYCCLGVLCEIALIPRIKSDYIYKNVSHHDHLSDMVSNSYPNELIKLFEISESEENHLIHLNDDEMSNFNAIADYIEENL